MFPRAGQRIYCDACELVRPAAGAVQHSRYALCYRCVTEFELAKARGPELTVGQYVRGRIFGEMGLYVLESILPR